jgi:predicted nucleotidyltransferase
MNEKLTAILAELRYYLEAVYGERLVKMVLYGSQARGDARPDSDIDVLTVLKEPFNYSSETERLSFIVAPLCLEHNVVIGYAFVTLKQFQQKNSAFFRNVRREGIAI